MRARRVLVTGASGFIGRCSVAALLGGGIEVHAVLSRRAAAHSSSQAPTQVPRELAGANLHRADLLNEADLDELLQRVKPTHLLHFAWMATPGEYWQSAENFRWLAASRYLLRVFREQGGHRAVLAGSCAEYDWSKAGMCDELTTPLAGASGATVSAYAASKLAMQSALAEFSRREKLSSAWGRIFFQFGPHEHPQRLVPSVILSLLEDREALCTHGRQVRSFLHVADLGAAFAQLLQSECEGPVNMGSDEPIALAALIEKIALEIGRPELLRLGARAAAEGEPALLVPNVRRLREEVGWRPRLSLAEGLTDTINWWRHRLGAA
jgi:nucleoside-diphosphate-sugar epimerase